MVFTPLTVAVRGSPDGFSPRVTVDGTPDTAAAPINANPLRLFAGAVTVAVSVARKVDTTVVADELDDPPQPDSEAMASVNAMRANWLGRMNLP